MFTSHPIGTQDHVHAAVTKHFPGIDWKVRENIDGWQSYKSNFSKSNGNLA
jgi:hypothetical protein